MRSLLVAIDIASENQSIVDAIENVAEPGRMRLVIVHVEPRRASEASSQQLGPLLSRETRLQQVLAKQQRLESLAASLESAGYEVTLRHVEGPTAVKITEVADQEQATLIMVGAGHYGVRVRTLAGSTSRAVLRQSSRPVVFVPPYRSHDGQARDGSASPSAPSAE